MDGASKLKAPSGSVEFLPLGKEIYFSEGESVLDVALRVEVPLDHSCGGNGSCGTCGVLVQSEMKGLSPMTKLEKVMSYNRGMKPNERLGCQLKAQDGLVVNIPTNEKAK